MSIGAGVLRYSLFCSLLVLGAASPLLAQNDQGRRQQVFENLLQSLIESQMNQPGSAPVPAAAPSNERLTVQPQIREVRQLAQSLSQELSRLFTSLNQDMRQNSNLATYFNAMLKVNASAAVLAQRSERAYDLESLKSDFVSLDQEWRQLSYLLNSTSGLSQTTIASIRTVNDYDQRLCKLFGVNAQIDSQQLQRLMESLEVSMKNLMDDISVELGWTNETRQLLLMGRLVEQQVRYMAYSSEVHNNRELAVAEYNKFQQLWGPYSAQLWPLKNRYIERNLQRIEQIDRDLNQVLLLPVPVNQRQLVRLADVLMTDMNALFEQATLADLMKLENSSNITRTSKDFHAAATRLTSSIKQNRDLNQLQADFRNVDQQWRLINESFVTLKKPEVLRLLKTTDQTMQSLKEGVQIRSAFDRDKALQLIAALENYGKHLQEDFSTFVVQGGRYDRGFAYQGLHTCHQFTAFANNIHQSLADGARPEDLRERCDTLSRGWQYLNNEYLQKLQGAERDRLGRLSADITPKIVQLQTMFEF